MSKTCPPAFLPVLLAVSLPLNMAFAQQPAVNAAPAAIAPPDSALLAQTTPAPAVAPVDAAATPAPLDANAPAPISPPGAVIDGTARSGAATVPATDLSSTAPAVNAAGPRAREFQGDDISQVVRLLARQARINIVVSPAVQGTVNMRLEDVTALRAIEIITQAYGLYFTNVDGVYYVKTMAEKAAEPTQADFYTFSYARANQVTALLTSQLQSKIPPQVDERTNTVFYQEAKSHLTVIRDFLRQVDRPTRQVMIEARLVEVTNNPRQSYGVNWAGVVGSSASPKTFRYGGTSNSSSAAQKLNDGTQTTGAGSTGDPQLVDFFRDARGIGTLAGAFGGQLAILSIPQFSATLRFLNEDADAEFLANPRSVTADNLEATIKIVRNQPVPQLNFNEQTATAVFGGFQDKIFGNTLIVKPSINKDDFITLSVKPEISNRIGDQVFNFGGATVSSPIIDTRTLEANVLIKSGCTLAIGGLLQDETSKLTNKVPILGDIPILGYLFTEKVNARTKRNLLVFVTPTIIRSEYGTGLEDQITGLKNSDARTTFADPNGWRNNAKGAVRLIKTPTRQVASDYPVPGSPDCRPGGAPSFKESVSVRGD
jgi:type IV pilus secretin PilQ/predicted competence protein